jgi:hypothetical protein
LGCVNKLRVILLKSLANAYCYGDETK